MAKLGESRPGWSTRKKDAAPRGLFRHTSGVWAIRFTCGAGHLHKERVGSLKTQAVARYHERRGRARSEPGWCPTIEARQERERVRVEQAKQRARVTFREYATQYGAWSKQHKRSWRTDASRIAVLTERFHDRHLDEIASLDIERFRDALLDGRTVATANRYRDLLSAIFRRAVRDGLVATNPVTAVSKLKENNQRVAYLTDVEESAIRDALPPEYHPHFLVSLYTGLRWSEQMGLRWRDVDMLTGFITVPRSKHGEGRRVPMHSGVRSALVDLGAARQRPNDPSEPVFLLHPSQSDVFFTKAVLGAAKALQSAGKDATRLVGYVWHSNRHTFASRLAMLGTDPLTLKELGGWKSLGMVQRYAHLTPNHLHQAVERLATPPPAAGAELARN
jgi:site-specific recombinase XerD